MTGATTPRADRILLVGVARSGTSWVGKALGTARGARLYFEPDNIGADPTGARPNGSFGFGAYPMIEPGETDNAFVPVWDMVFSGRMPFNVRGRTRLRPVARVAVRLPRAVRDPLVRGVAAVSNRMPAKPGCTIVKSIYSMFSLDWLVWRYQPQVLAIQRHPLNVVSSWRQLDFPLFDIATRPVVRERFLTPLGIDPPGADASELATIAWHVGLLTHIVGEAVDRHQWRLVTHEDLCADPIARVRNEFDQLGLTWTLAAERFLTENNRPGEGWDQIRVAAEQPDRWRSRLNAAEVAEAQHVLSQFPRQGWVRAPVPAVP